MNSSADVSGEATLDDALEQVVKPNAEKLAGIAADGDIAVAVWRPSGEAIPAAKLAGWDGKEGMVRMARACRRWLSGADPVTARWFSEVRPRVARIFVFAEGATYLVNFEPAVGYSCELGPADSATTEGLRSRRRLCAVSHFTIGALAEAVACRFFSAKHWV